MCEWSSAVGRRFDGFRKRQMGNHSRHGEYVLKYFVVFQRKRNKEEIFRDRIKKNYFVTLCMDFTVLKFIDRFYTSHHITVDGIFLCHLIKKKLK